MKYLLSVIFVLALTTVLFAVSNGRYVGSLLICDNGLEERGGCCVNSNGSNQSTQGYGYSGGVGITSPSRPYSYGGASGFNFNNAPSPSYKPTSGSTYDLTSGNSYTWSKGYDGTTHMSGMNLNTGSTWSADYQKDGSMRGFDSKMNMWSYDSGSGTYINYGTGRMCIGKGAARICN
ncbi:MAG: hypothetical protein JXK05_09660 [Campylobacterales bacterium]|nr:hypothetical protein [Campylobacterales bacterium]